MGTPAAQINGLVLAEILSTPQDHMAVTSTVDTSSPYILLLSLYGWDRKTAGTALNHCSLAHLLKTNLNDMFWRFGWGGPPILKETFVSLKWLILTFSDAYSGANSFPPPRCKLRIVTGLVAETPRGNTQRSDCKSHTQTVNKSKRDIHPQHLLWTGIT